MDLSTPNTTGADTLVITLSEDAWQGDARFTVAVDGQQLGGEYTASAQHGTDTDSLTLQGDWGSGQHDLTITFVNDAYGGSGDTDRNLYVDGVTYNGTPAAGADAALYSNGAVDLAFAGGSVPDDSQDGDTSGQPAEDTSGDPQPGGDTAATGDMPATRTVWFEDFNDGTGMLSRVWGNVDTGTSGQITLTSYAQDGWTLDSGAMVPPTGADAGYGYGVYSFTLSMSNDAPGPYALLWPATDIWPGPELDVVEQTPGGNAYSTVHWKDDNGDNAFQSYGADGIDTTQVHTYAIDWQRDHIDYFVDGRMTAHVTDQVPLNYADGGQNSAPGVGMQTWWSIDAQHGDNSMTVYDVSYAVVA